MTSTSDAGLGVEHPAPQRGRAHPLLVLFALIGSPAAWMIQLLVAFAVTSYVCSAPVRVAQWVSPAIAALNLVALVAAAAASLVAGSMLRQTRTEHSGAASNVLDAGEGRTRFLATLGICLSTVFMIATLANTVSLFVVPSCRP